MCDHGISKCVDTLSICVRSIVASLLFRCSCRLSQHGQAKRTARKEFSIIGTKKYNVCHLLQITYEKKGLVSV